MKLLRRALVVLITAGLAFVAVGGAQPVWASHGNDYNPQNNDVAENRSTTYADVLALWSDPPNYMDPCRAFVTNNYSSTLRARVAVIKRSNGDEVWSSGQINVGAGDQIEVHPLVGDIADVHEPYMIVVMSTTGGGWLSTITMDPYKYLAGKDHAEAAYGSQWWSDSC